jgi:hypothetical protein
MLDEPGGVWLLPGQRERRGVPRDDLGARPATQCPLAHGQGRARIFGSERQRLVEPRRDLRAEWSVRRRPQLLQRRRDLAGRRERASGRDDVGAIKSLIVEERPGKRCERHQVRRRQAGPHRHSGEFQRRS